MKNEETITTEALKIEKNEKEELSFCTSAPSAEHSRAHDNDEPCDDGREGNVD